MNTSAARTTRHPRTRVAAAVALAAALVAPPVASSATDRADEAPTTSGDTRQAARDQLDASLDALTAAGAIGAVGYSRNAKGTLWSGASGVRSIDAGRPAEPKDVARIGSVTKAMVATLVVQEVERGHWTLDTTVDAVLPGLLPGHGEVTLEQLLSHRTGLPDYILAVTGDGTDQAAFLAALEEDRTDAELVDAALTEPWLFAPGTAFSYSNTNYVVAGMMLQKLTRRSMSSLLEKRVFRPAGMRSADYPTRGRTFRTRAHLTDYAQLERPYNLDDTSSTLFSAAGAVVASAPDMAAFYRALFAGRLVSTRSLETMFDPRSTEPLRYGLGIYEAVDPCPDADGNLQRLYGHDGATFGTVSVVFTSADGSRQAAVAFGGRQLVLEPPTLPAANQVLVDALTASCPREVPDQARQRATADLDRLSADLDAQLLPEVAAD